MLISAALLRGWMNWLRISMRAQPGLFVMAVTDWLVKPLRRLLPKTLAHSRLDWASVLCAGALSLVFALLWSLLAGTLSSSVGGGAPSALAIALSLLGFALKMTIRVALQTLFFMVLAFAVLSWVQPGSALFHQLGRLTAPLTAPLQRILPTIGGIDLSALVLMLLLQVGLMVVGNVV